jgi:ketosteroid isomerase-like protein
MKKRIVSALFVFACIAPVFAEAPKPQPQDSPDVAAVKQVEEVMGKAMIAQDVDKLSQIYGDDFATVGSGGKVTTKKDLLTDFESFHDKLEWYENGPMDVLVFGNVALAQGSVKEKRSRDDKDTSGQFLWMDVLEKRAGKWVVVQSAAGRVVLADPVKAQLSEVQSPKGQSLEVQSKDPTAVEAIKKFEDDIGEAMVARDIDKLNQTYADDWATVGPSGKVFNKESLLSDFKSGRHTLVSFENGPMEVQVLGDVAVVQASVAEKRIQDGKDISGQFVFMDLLKKREGKWVVVRTLGAKLS